MKLRFSLLFLSLSIVVLAAFTLKTPKSQDHISSLGTPMKSFVSLPPKFAITNISCSNSVVYLSWNPGNCTGPFNVWCSTNTSGPWKVIASPVSNNFVSIPAIPGNCFFKIEQPPTNTITILDDNRFGSATTDVYWAAAWIETVNFTTNDCAVGEGCALPGPQKLLRFPVTVWNPNAVNYWYGPTGNFYYFDPCHNHFHLTNFSKFTLIGTNVEVNSQKMGWCVRNFGRVLDLTWNTNPPSTSCISPSLMPGWADTYNIQSCMWWNISGLPDGTYTMRIELDPLKVYGFYVKSEHQIQMIGTNIIYNVKNMCGNTCETYLKPKFLIIPSSTTH